MEHRKDILREKTTDFAVRIVNLSRYLKEQKREYTLSEQILKSGTNPGAMSREAKNAESGPDFIHKLSIAQKEIAETQFWLEILWRTKYITEQEYTSMLADSDEIIKILVKSINTRRKNLKS